MYTAFASVYDRLMADVDYQGWARFYHSLMERYGIPRGKVCECACGTGSITIALSRLGYQMTGVDLSADMLFEASQKARKSGAMIPFVKQDMRTLHLHRQMDAVLLLLTTSFPRACIISSSLRMKKSASPRFPRSSRMLACCPSI